MAANRLDGLTGNDEMRGSKGDDTYVVSQTGDKAYELKYEGTDTVLSSVSYDLMGQHIERLTLTGTSAINGTGNSLDNVLAGNAAANRLDGMRGVDEMRGGKGNDTYVVSQTGDKAYELKDEGIDTVLSSAELRSHRPVPREADPDRHVDDKRHRQHARQCPDRQQRGQRARRQDRRRQDVRRRR